MQIGYTALEAMHRVHERLGKDPKKTYVAMVTAACASGHMIERTREEMHATLDEVFETAQALVLEATETRQ